MILNMIVFLIIFVHRVQALILYVRCMIILNTLAHKKWWVVEEATFANMTQIMFYFKYFPWNYSLS